MSIENAVRNRAVLLEQVGKTALNIRYPKEFELYLCALELLDADGRTLKYFIFPVMPSGIVESMPQLTNIKKTLAGVTVLTSPTFVPTDISLNGNFGRKFRVLLGTDTEELISSFTDDAGKVTGKSLANGVVDFFDTRVKTGYGCIKILQEIIELSNQVNSETGGMKKLIFYNQALGNSYIVKATNLTFNQSQDTNMIWNYSLQLKSIAPLEAILSPSEIQNQNFRLDTTGYIQGKTNDLVNNLTSMIANADTALTNKLPTKWN